MCIINYTNNSFSASILTSVSLDPLPCPLGQSNAVSPQEFPSISDDDDETCYNFSDIEYLTLSFEFISHDSGINHFLLIMKAAQDCDADNLLWFVDGGSVSIKPSECSVNQITIFDNKLCEITCRCMCATQCSHVYFQVQQLPWLDNRLSICHWEHVLAGQVVEPKVIW